MNTDQRPPAFELDSDFRFSHLSDDKFEGLLYDIYKTEVELGTNPSWIDDVDKTLGVREQGRDVKLLYRGSTIGIVQCKHVKGLLTKPDAVREIIKLFLNSLLDPSIIPNPNGFRYILAVSSDLNGKAKSLKDNFVKTVLEDPSYRTWISEVIDQYESFTGMSLEAVEPKITDLFKQIIFDYLNQHELSRRLLLLPSIQQRYFQLKTVIDEGLLEKHLDPIHKTLQQLTDRGVTEIAQRLQDIPSGQRFDLGVISFWGYPHAFLRDIISQPSPNLVHAITAAQSQLDHAFLDFIMKRIHNEIQNNLTPITTISPFTKQAAAPYLYSKLSDRVARILVGAPLYAQFKEKQGEVAKFSQELTSIRDYLLQIAAKVIVKDYSFLDNDPLRADKIPIFQFTHSGLVSVEQAKSIFDTEANLMRPILTQIEERIAKELPPSFSVILQSGNVFDDAQRLSNVIKGADALLRK